MDEHFRHRPHDRHVEPMFAALHADERAGEPDAAAPRTPRAARLATLALLTAAALAALAWLWS